MGLLKRWKESCAEHGKELAEETARELYQITEHDGQIWLTYNDNLICPMAMFEEKDAVCVLLDLRNIYVKDTNPNKEYENGSSY